MTGTFKVEMGKFRITSGAFQHTGHQMKHLADQMESLVNGISENVWSGDAARAYQKKFRDLNDDVRKMLRMVDEHVKDLHEMCREYEAAENKAESLANSLASDVIQ